MPECNHNCEGCTANCADRQNNIAPAKFQTQSVIKNVIGIVSGKGGVGKSLITGLLASEMSKKNFNTAILDADITGPSIPKMFGLHDTLLSDGHFIQPAISKNGTKIISMNLCLPSETDPVVWRGPVLMGVLQQFFEEVDWGFTDYMFVDMPPGTGDVPLTVFQSLPIKGIIIVTTPQELVSMIVSKALKMAEIMNIPVLGLVENMSYFLCPDCNKKHYIFGNSNLEEFALTHGIQNFVQIPILPEFARYCDSGKIEDFDASKYLDSLIKNL
ncbi:MAG: Mrp/NBP35 family ATP-binding protein [Synergistaceae bacterium]|nr:Mrp/NBP35 family ATP-binding protein [Synergistaceae bacterium]